MENLFELKSKVTLFIVVLTLLPTVEHVKKELRLPAVVIFKANFLL
jgi:hypothetical protein